MIIAVDPGPHTGIAIWYEAHVPEFVFETLYLKDQDRPYVFLADYLDVHVFADDTIVLERFEFQKEKAQQRPHLNFQAAEYVGAVKLWHEQLTDDERCTLVTQSPSFAVGNDDSIFWTDAKLKYLNLYQLTKSKHERSALRHLLQYVSVTLDDKRFIYALKGM
jgi:hypothetical protein